MPLSSESCAAVVLCGFFVVFPAFEMSLAEGIHFERRFFHQTFATVISMLLFINKAGIEL